MWPLRNCVPTRGQVIRERGRNWATTPVYSLVCALVCVAPRLPEPSERVVGGVNLPNPFDPPDAVPTWNQQTQRTTMKGRDGLPVHLPRQNRVPVDRFREWHRLGELRELVFPAVQLRNRH